MRNDFRRGVFHHLRNPFLALLQLLWLLSSSGGGGGNRFLLFCNAAIYVDNFTFPSLTALFGKAMVEHNLYHARLQFLTENPFLCEAIDRNNTSLVIPPPPELDGIKLHPDPIVLLASRGNCPFARKAAVAEAIPQVSFLIIYNNDPENENTIVPMYSEYGQTRLVLLSTTRYAGWRLREYLAQLSDAIRYQQGGPLIAMDSLPPPGLVTVEQLQELFLTAIGLFFLLISLSGCLLLMAGTYGQIQYDQRGRAVWTAGTSSTTHHPMQHRQPGGLRGVFYSSQSENADELLQNLPTLSLEQKQAMAPLSCAICLADDEDFGSIATTSLGGDGTDTTESPTAAGNAAWTLLPCQHYFHTECIGPWLIERQPKCPLCKGHVWEQLYEQQQQQQQQQHSLASSTPTASAEISEEPNHVEIEMGSPYPILHRGVQWWERLTRTRGRWTRLNTTNPPMGASVMATPASISPTNASTGTIISPMEMELTEQHSIT